MAGKNSSPPERVSTRTGAVAIPKGRDSSQVMRKELPHNKGRTEPKPHDCR